MYQGFRHFTISLMSVLLIRLGFALAASVWATLPDAHLTHGMYSLAAQ